MRILNNEMWRYWNVIHHTREPLEYLIAKPSCMQGNHPPDVLFLGNAPVQANPNMRRTSTIDAPRSLSNRRLVSPALLASLRPVSSMISRWWR